MSSGISIVIPTLNAGPQFAELLRQLAVQTTVADEVLVIDSASTDNTVAIARHYGARVHAIERKDFNHGGTRNVGAALTGGEVVCFLTQDAIPNNERFLQELCEPLRQHKAAAAFARQVPHYDAWPPEALARAWNYPDKDEWRHQNEREQWGLRYVFFSNVASAVRRDQFEACGRFPSALIMNEDVVLAARLLESGETIAYLSAAEVRHSHNYSVAQQFRRYFDIGVFHARHADLIPAVGVGSEGRRFVLRQMRGLLSTGQWGWIPRTLWETIAKYVGFKLGKAEAQLGRSLKRRLSMHRGFWA